MEQYTFEPESVKTSTKPIASKAQKATLSLVKVYLWFALGLLITGAVSLGLPNLLVLFQGTAGEETMDTIYLVGIVVSVILMIPALIVLNIQAFRKNVPLIITTYIVYALAMGVLLSTVFLAFVGPGEGMNTICVAFFVTGGIFLINGILAALMKKTNLNMLWPILSSLVIGVLTISLVNIFIGSETIYWIVEFVIFGVMLVSTLLDMHNIHKLAESGQFENSTNLSIYCGFMLYVDFIWLFIRILYYIAIFAKKNN